jgi:integrase|tara:strand:+ start:229 stop:2052 length:1824 start_codon:yes stop_codon:yes gene_type:complete
MSNRNYLARGTKPYQYWYFHCIIPKDLRDILGKSVIRISLKNSDYCYSKNVAHTLYFLTQTIFKEFRIGKMKDITLEDVKDILRIEVKKSLLHIHHYEYGTNVFDEEKLNESISKADKEEEKLRDKLQKDYRGTLGLIESEIDKILISQKIIPDKFNIEYKGLVRRWIELKLKRQDWKKELLNKSGKNDDDFRKEIEKEWSLGLWANDDVRLTPIIEGDNIPEPREPYLTQSNSIEVKYNKVESSPSPLFSEVILKHLELMERNKRRGQTIKETEQTYEDVIELIGDKPISEYTNTDGRDYRTSIISLPKNRKKMKQYRDFNLHELLKMDVPEEDRLSVDTQSKLISRMTSLWNFLIDEYPDYVTQNVFKKKSVTISSRKAKDKRDNFTDEDIQTIFHHKNYLPSIFEGNTNQTIKFPYYWIPILACLCGARLEELCQMRVKDIIQVDGIWVYRIREIGKYNEEETRVKNPHSERDIPLHSELIDTLDFIKYVNHVKKMKKERVFWELKKRGNGYRKNVGKFFNEKYLVKMGIKKRGKSFHSFRHSVETHLTNQDVNGRFIDFLQGHSQKGIGGSVYMKGIKMNVLLMDCVEKIKWDVNWKKLKVKW